MATIIINVSCDKQVCAQCGKIGKGYFESTSEKGKYICHKCVIKNIDRRPERNDNNQNDIQPRN